MANLLICDFISYICNAWLPFWSILNKIGSLLQRNDLKWHTFRKGTFQDLSIARQIYHLDSWNLVENCPIASSYRNIYHCLTIISYIVFRILNVKEGYPTPKYQILTIAQDMAYGGQYLLFNFCITEIELKSNAKHKIQIHQWHVGVIGFTNVYLCISFQCTKQCQKLYARLPQNIPIALLIIYLNMYCMHRLTNRSKPVSCCFRYRPISSTDHSCFRLVETLRILKYQDYM